ncbi:TIGR02679 family protein [Egibacter rhizosphaerae]|uniref:TIGR02679 family protein n=1 Tax=Egibacter rhizosphaerae TaxID=1670831 RepID=A0A411YIB3_9ACTN|nr:TIGR02679 family protein [Egibacter rhizosphaerae]QBI20869.1 TIGR02679 family protein [Egibacter rhizosphaerae]
MGGGAEVDQARLEALLGDPALSWLVERCARRLARGQTLTGTMTLAEASRAQREAAARLLGRHPGRGSSLSVPLARVAEVLAEAGIAGDLATAVQALAGPVDDEHAAALAHEARWQQLWQWARARVLADDDVPEDHGPRARWVAQLRADGLLRRLSASDPDRAWHLLEAAAAVIDELPAAGESRSVLAARVIGDGHALDDDRPVTTLVLRAIDELAPGQPAGDRRERWAAAGVTVDPLTSRVVVLGLPGDEASVSGRTLSLHADAGEPATLTLRELVRAPPDLAASAVQPVFVCENPSIVAAAADRLGASSAPLVCTHGQPTVAAWLLLDRLAAAGARLHVQADLDWAGMRIASAVMRRTGASPWRLCVADYEAAAERSSKRLTGPAAEAPWDPALPTAMHARGIAVEEELMLEELLSDLAIDPRSDPRR